jgi:hypothetical protein
VNAATPDASDQPLTAPQPTLDQLDLLDHEVGRRLDYQMTELDGLDAKATTVLAATGVVFGLAGTGLQAFDTSSVVAVATVYLALVLLVAGLGAGVRNLWPQRPMIVPEPEPFLRQYWDKSTPETRTALAFTRAKAFTMNKPFVEAKARWLRVQMIVLVIGAICLAGAYIYRAMG